MALLGTMIKTLMAALLALGPLVLPAKAATFSMKRGLNLDQWVTWPTEDKWGERQAILPYPEWRKFLKDDDLKTLKDAGLDFLRMPVDPAPFLSDRTTALRDELYAGVLDSARMINRAGLKVVVDLHLIPADGNRRIGMGQVMDDPAVFDAYAEVVRNMARTLAKEDPEQVALELMNEPIVDCDENGTSLWPERQKQLFAAARASATRLTLVLTGGCYSNAASLAKIDAKAIADDNIIWAFHSYDPFLLTHQGATWAGDFIQYVTGLPYPLTAVPKAQLDMTLDTIRDRIRAEAPWARRSGMLAYLDEQVATMDSPEKLLGLMDQPFRTVEAWAKANGVKPQDITLGEFGMIRKEYGNGFVIPAAYRAAYVRDMIARAEAHGFSWSVWSYGGAFGIVDAFDGEKAEPDVMDVIRQLPR
ncbi:glycosyl hydrolase [Mesorhizobium sp. M2D.F.Ca.ET.185.01.1.1]|uniref:glycoside hydrolase family 5 protein n=1 Tax=unclassified Mesorhizobium TaxID=325217 RepID=UPI000FCBFF93|nr:MULTISPECIES: cellulase family glycosylhydrolase [unclassified Mesorhizobium]TGP83468.1 glycosyl hydrolase [bacterium M00.F.Ca.ET.227.01.1.1]TGP99423.1 glycosyl hydrolase [bacterium M00.F.Ca.ET.221.01.1.1]TGQ00153.1 glycosyl hydrolase [bacterium M00.F.Ca.ET.222.01.1.1]TGU11539.1 glycosyl hydrolase [bacterium M00.F.Ca.ET.163.01.1.1]TGU35138.1 glycosyl hydrolase [bacterium M00.F.Ca.ET.156.01.1.1]TGU51484.1 glycosyl hydrolase [bacterium M00.F.Ca.ET.146.01.1.1]TGV71553.1 glycosyl hydrolase [M